MDIFEIVGRAIVTLILPLAPLFLMILFAGFVVNTETVQRRSESDQINIFIGAISLAAYILFLIVFFPNIWW